MNGLKSGLFGLWLRFGSVTGFFKPAPSPKPRQSPKILAPNWLQYFFKRSQIKFGKANRNGATVSREKAIPECGAVRKGLMGSWINGFVNAACRFVER